MNPVEIEEAISHLASAPYDSATFVWSFLEAFGNKATTIAKLKGSGNKSDIPDAVLLRRDIHIATCPSGEVPQTLSTLIASPLTNKSKVKYVLATDGEYIQAQRVDIDADRVIFCKFSELAQEFGFFLPLAGITTTKQIEDNPIDVSATGRLDRLYIELLKTNTQWAEGERRHDMNQFMARLIFCFFAEDTNIFDEKDLFTNKIKEMSDSQSEDTHIVISELFKAMNTEYKDRDEKKIKGYALKFPYVNGQLFSGNQDVPKFSRTARTQLLYVGELDWKRINPDIFGSMIQAIKDQEERGNLGMHYTSVPNIKRVLDPLFLNDLRTQLEKAGKSSVKLLNLKKRMSKIRVFDPACGSGNFLVIAYKEMRAIEDEINQRRKETHLSSALSISNFRGIELEDFPAQIARLALIIAEFQCDDIYRGQKEALSELLPLNSTNWIICGNALQLDWLSVCPPTGTSVKLVAEDLLHTPLEQAEVDFENEGGETYICGNPPYIGDSKMLDEQKADLKSIFDGRAKNWGSLDYVAGWFMKAADYGTRTNASSAFVSTNSICQGDQVPILWPCILKTGHKINFAYTSFRWSNLAKYNAGVVVIIVGISNNVEKFSYLHSIGDNEQMIVEELKNINPYLKSGSNIIIEKQLKPFCGQAEMNTGNKPTDGGNLLLLANEIAGLQLSPSQKKKFIKRFIGSSEFIKGLERYCLWIEDKDLEEAQAIKQIDNRIKEVKKTRLASPDKSAHKMAERPHQMREMYSGKRHTIVVPAVSSENRDYLPVGLVSGDTILSNRNFALYDAPLWNMALIASRLHHVWVSVVCGKLGTSFNYSNTMGWNTFPIPSLTEKNKNDLIQSAEEILLTRETHYPATIADLYKSGEMPDNLRRAHEHNDEIIERIYIGRRFKNDTERSEKLFSMYEKMIIK